MYDPMTVAFELRSPFKNERGYRACLLTIWHVDPETDGTDNSCGYSYPKTRAYTEQIKKLVKEIAFQEYGGMWDEKGVPRCSPEQGLYGIFQWVAFRCLGERLRPSDLPVILSSMFNLDNNLRLSFKVYDDTERNRVYNAESTFHSCLRVLLQNRRPWYRHPKWHFWHWQIQIPFMRDLKRWLFSKCSLCGKGFAWGYAPICNTWNGKGPRWFRREPNVEHHNCKRPGNEPGAMRDADKPDVDTVDTVDKSVDK